jgi:hypothetical protein
MSAMRLGVKQQQNPPNFPKKKGTTVITVGKEAFFIPARPSAATKMINAPRKSLA